MTNTGSCPSTEAAQLYIAPPKGGFHRPEQELKGFAQVELTPDESKRVSFPLNDRSFAVWDSGCKVHSGVYEIRVGTFSRDIRLTGTLEPTGEAVSVPGWQTGSWYKTMSGAPSRPEREHVMGHAAPVTPEPKKGQFTLDSTCLKIVIAAVIFWLSFKVSWHDLTQALDLILK